MKQSIAFLRFQAFRKSSLWFFAADMLAVLLAVMLPWSTSIFVIVLMPLLAIIIGSVDVHLFVRALLRPASLASIAVFIVALLGVFWSTENYKTGLHALGPVLKLVVLPFFFYYFEVSKRGMWVIGAYLLSCSVLMINSWVVTFDPSLAFKTGRCCGEDYGVPVRNYIDQSQEFGICLVVLVSATLTLFQQNKWRMAALSGAAAAAFAANLVFVVVSRTALVCIPVMFVVLAGRRGGLRGIISIIAVGCIFVLTAASISSHLRNRIWSTLSQYQEYRDYNAASSVGKRLEFWRKSLTFFKEAPVVGHGTGTTHGLFERDAIGKVAVSAEVIANPHNQILGVAVQWGALGLLALFGLWATHLQLLWRDGFIPELGILVVVQNISGSLFNSHLFDFAEGWLYVLGVGIAGGIIAKTAAARPELDVSNDHR